MSNKSVQYSRLVVQYAMLCAANTAVNGHRFNRPNRFDLRVSIAVVLDMALRDCRSRHDCEFNNFECHRCRIQFDDSVDSKVLAFVIL